MVSAAKRNSKFIADLQAQSTTLGETDVMSIARLLFADDAWLLCDKLPVTFITHTSRFRHHTALSVFVRLLCFFVMGRLGTCWGEDRIGLRRRRREVFPRIR